MAQAREGESARLASCLKSPQLSEQLVQARATIAELQAANDELRSRIELLEAAATTPSLPNSTGTDAAPGVAAAGGVSAASPAAVKLALFQRLFRGRDDVYAIRWESRDGRSGYSPALRPGAPRGRGVKHEADDYLPLTPAAVRTHLTGTSTLGIYPLQQDESCWLLAIDFDKAGWQEDVVATLDACEALGIPAALERSRSGQGAHLWVFFTEPVPASLARNLGSAVLTEALDRRYQIGLDSYDRLFPSQDTLPAGGFGNLIALPLQGLSRRAGNTVFVDRHLMPYPDQWRSLASVRRLEPADAERIVRDALHADRLLSVGPSPPGAGDEDERTPWTLPPSRRQAEGPIPGPLPATVRAVLASRLFIEEEGLPPILVNRLRRLAAFQNPEFYRAQAMRLSTFGKPRLIDCSEDFPGPPGPAAWLPGCGRAVAHRERHRAGLHR
jgi:hypothetical protein